MFTPDELDENWDLFLGNIVAYTEPGQRRDALLEFYNKHTDVIGLMPASGNTAHHSAFPGGYVFHVNRVVECCHYLYKVWNVFGGCEGFTLNELMFAAINHDLGKMGDGVEELYIPTNDNYKNKRGIFYDHNPLVEFMTIPDRSLYLIHTMKIEMTPNEWVAIKTHDGLYDEANKAYLFSYIPESKMRTNMAYILHQADMIAARTEFTDQWLKTFTASLEPEPVQKEANTGLKTKLNKI